MMNSSKSLNKPKATPDKPSNPRPPGQKSLVSFFRPRTSQPTVAAPPTVSSQPAGPKIHTPVKKTPKTPAQTPKSSRIAVVLAPSPGLRESQYAQHDELEDDDDAPPANLISDLSPQFRRLAAQAQASKPISLSRPNAAYDGLADEPDELAQPRAKLQSRGEQLSPPKKKRGRPKGYRPSLMLSASQATVDKPSKAKEGAKRRVAEKPVGSYYAGPKKRGRPPKPPPPKPRELYESLKPMFQRFICEWERCPAELHNLETLERHVDAVHVRRQAAGGQFFCQWGGCEAAPGAPVRLFRSAEELQEHVDEVHMSLQRWHAGDGPRITQPGVMKGKGRDDEGELPAYLFKGGEQVTPSIKGQKEEDLATYRERKQKLKNLLALRDMNAPNEDEEFEMGDGEDEGRQFG